MSRSSIQLLIIYCLSNLFIQNAFAQQTTLMLPLHTALPQYNSPSYKSITNTANANALANTSIPTSSAINDLASTQPLPVQATTDSTTTNQSISEPTNTSSTDTQQKSKPELKKLKGIITVPANPYRGVNNSSTPFAPEGQVRRGLPAPLDPVFPSTEYVGIASQIQIGVPDQDPMFPLEKAIYKACPLLAKNRIKIYGWGQP